MYYERYLDKVIIDKKSEKKVKLLLGPRQSGKSTLLKHCIRKSEKTLFINLQNRRERIKYEKNPEAFLQELEAAKNINTVVIDEIQKVPGLLEDVQYFYDNNPDSFNFFLTGSSARKLKTGSANMLPGRIHLFKLSAVLQAEQRDPVLLPLTMSTKKKFPMRQLEEYLIYGALPGLYSETPESWQETLTAYTELYIENEIRKENVVNDMGAFLTFLKLAAMESGQTVNYSKMASVVGVALNTIRNFYQILEDTYIGFRIPAFGRSRKKIMTAPRFLIFDLGMRNILAELPLNKSLIQIDAGHIFEQFIMIELFYRCQYHGKGHKLSTWRTTTGAEVDAIIETPDEVIPIEIKWTDSPTRKDIRHIETFLDLHKDIAYRGFIICRTDTPRRLSKKITALPWDEF